MSIVQVRACGVGFPFNRSGENDRERRLRGRFRLLGFFCAPTHMRKR